MNIKVFSDKVLLPTERDVLRVHLYFKMVQYGLRPFENDMDIIIELYLFGGYDGPAQQKRFINMCMDKKFKKSAQSVRNTLSKYVTMGVFHKKKNAQLSINDKFIPNVECNKYVLQHTISHAN